MANNSTHRPATIQRVRLGATPDGKITAFAHETWSGNLPGGSAEVGILASRALYAGANRMTATRLAALDLPEGNAMRAPGDAPGSMAFEIAIDEMAHKLNLDPVEFRVLQRYAAGSGEAGARVLHAQAGRMPAYRRGEVRLEPSQCAARQGARRPLARGAGRGDGVSRRARAQFRGARAAGCAGCGHRRNRHDRHRHRQLHHHPANRRRDDGRAARARRRETGRFAFSGLGRFRRTIRRGERHFRCVCRVHEVARSRGAEAGRGSGRHRFRRRRRRRQRQAHAARRGRRPGRPRGRRQDRVRERRATSTCSTPLARTSSKWRWTR